MSYSNHRDIKVGIVDDSPLVRQMIEQVVNDTDGMCVVGAAADPFEAREMIKTVSPDVLTLDVEMPRMDGLSFLEKIMTLRPMPVIMVSTLTQKAADVTLHALQTGAVDYVGKPMNNSSADEYLSVFRAELIPKIYMASLINKSALGYSQHVQPQRKVTQVKAASPYDIIGIAASTGGVERLRYLLSSLRLDMPPVLIVQHINKNYIANMVERLNGITPQHITVEIARHNQKLCPNHVYLADNNQHLTLKHRNAYCAMKLVDAPPLNGFIASADYLFNSMAALPYKHMLGVILSGLGNDGAEGLLNFKNAGGQTVGENEQSCLVYGMSRAAAKLGALCSEVSLDSIVNILNKEAPSNENRRP